MVCYHHAKVKFTPSTQVGAGLASPLTASSHSLPQKKTGLFLAWRACPFRPPYMPPQQAPTICTEACPPAWTLGMDHFNSRNGSLCLFNSYTVLSCNQTVYQEGYQQILCALLLLDGTGIELKKP